MLNDDDEILKELEDVFQKWVAQTVFQKWVAQTLPPLEAQNLPDLVKDFKKAYYRGALEMLRICRQVVTDTTELPKLRGNYIDE